MMMNLFNMVNCRVLGSKSDPQYNIVSGIHRNWWFLIVLLAEFNMQFLLVGYPSLGLLFSTTPLTVGMHVTALLLGFGSLGVAAAVKATPYEWTDKFPSIKEVDDENSYANKLESALFQRSYTGSLMEE